MTDDMTDEEFYEKYWGVIDPVDNSVDYDTLASLANEVKQLRKQLDELYNDWRKVWYILDRKGIGNEIRQEFPHTFYDSMESEEE
tara:strand:+ start:224 stop:478 length:255 start_codon:yes stop_codon:yes gene_type:complete